MAEHQNIPGSANHRIGGTTILYATLSGLAIGVPLLGMMGFTLLASLTLLLVASPLLLLFSPVILPAAFVVAASMAGFSLAAAMAVVGVSTSMLALRYVRSDGDLDGVKAESEGRMGEPWWLHASYC